MGVSYKQIKYIYIKNLLKRQKEHTKNEAMQNSYNCFVLPFLF